MTTAIQTSAAFAGLCLLGAADLAELEPLIERYTARADWPAPIEPSALLERFEGLMRDRHGLVLGLRTEDGRLEGFAALVLYPDLLSGDFQASVLGLYLDDAGRHDRRGDALLRAAELAAHRHGARRILMGHNTRDHHRPGVMARWLRRRRYRPLECIYSKEL